jgi:hypothetical protein
LPAPGCAALLVVLLAELLLELELEDEDELPHAASRLASTTAAARTRPPLNRLLCIGSPVVVHWNEIVVSWIRSLLIAQVVAFTPAR